MEIREREQDSLTFRSLDVSNVVMCMSRSHSPRRLRMCVYVRVSALPRASKCNVYFFIFTLLLLLGKWLAYVEFRARKIATAFSALLIVYVPHIYMRV